LELAKVYSTSKSTGFINGVISTIYGEKDVWKSN
jgi:transcription termination factor NusB